MKARKEEPDAISHSLQQITEPGINMQDWYCSPACKVVTSLRGRGNFNNPISFGMNSLAFRGSILWNAMPDTIKSAENVSKFKEGIKVWNRYKCSCNICK